MSLDMDSLKRRGVVMGNTPSVHYTAEEHRAVVAELGRIPELEARLRDKDFELTGTHAALRKAIDERDGWKAEIGRLTGLHRQALAERDAEIDRLAGHTLDDCEADAIQAEYEELAAAVRKVVATNDAGLESADEDGFWQTAEWEAHMAAMDALRAALADALAEETTS